MACNSLKDYQFDAPDFDYSSESASLPCCNDGYTVGSCRARSPPREFVRTRAQADYEIIGVTHAFNLRWEEGVGDHVTIRQATTVRMTRIKSGEIVFHHSVQTLVRSPNDARIVHWPELPHQLKDHSGRLPTRR